jgi:hypothetical protein
MCGQSVSLPDVTKLERRYITTAAAFGRSAQPWHTWKLTSGERIQAPCGEISDGLDQSSERIVPPPPLPFAARATRRPFFSCSCSSETELGHQYIARLPFLGAVSRRTLKVSECPPTPGGLTWRARAAVSGIR